MQVEREFNSVCFHASSPWTGLCPAAQSFLFSNEVDGVSEVWRSEKNAICCVAIFTADVSRLIPETAGTNGNGGVFILKKCIWKTPK